MKHIVMTHKEPYYIGTRAISNHSGADEQSFMRSTFPYYIEYVHWISYPKDVDLELTTDPPIRVRIPRAKISKVSSNGPAALVSS